MVKSSKKQKSGHDAQLKAKKGLKVDKVVCKNKGSATSLKPGWREAAADALLAELVRKADGDDKVARLQRVLGYTFKDPKLLEQALTLASARTGPHNARLAWLGDSVLQLVVSELLFEARPGATVKELSAARQLLETRKMCSTLGSRLGIGELLTRGKNHGLKPAMEAEAVEALLGAVYLDSGLSHHTVKQVYLAIGQAVESSGEQVVQHGCSRGPEQQGNGAAASAPPGNNVWQGQVQQQYQQQYQREEEEEEEQQQQPSPQGRQKPANKTHKGWQQQQQQQQQQQPRKQASSAAKGKKKKKKKRGSHLRFE